MSGKKVPVFTTGNVNKPSVPYIPTSNDTCVNALKNHFFMVELDLIMMSLCFMVLV